MMLLVRLRSFLTLDKTRKGFKGMFMLLVCGIVFLFFSVNVVTNQQYKYMGPVALHHEQTIAVVTHNGQDHTIDRCRLILAESNDKFDKTQLLEYFATKMPVQLISFDTMLSVVQVCQDIQPPPREFQTSKKQTNSSEEAQISLWTLARGILPGTLWCGLDDIADDFYSLGPDWQLDKCCRAHDHCPVKVKAFKSRYGVFNVGPSTKSHCACDKQFYDCLKRQNSEKSNSVGNLYFNVIGVQCIEKRVRRECIKREEIPTEASEKIFNIGVAVAKPPPSRCLAWRTEPPERAKFVVVNTKEDY